MHFTSFLLLSPLLLSTVDASKHAEHRRHHVKRKLCARNSTSSSYHNSSSSSNASSTQILQVAGFAVKNPLNVSVGLNVGTSATAPAAVKTTTTTTATIPKTTTTTIAKVWKTTTTTTEDDNSWDTTTSKKATVNGWVSASATLTAAVSIGTAVRSSNSSNFGLDLVPKLPSGIHFGWVPSDGSSGASETIQEVLSSVGQTVSSQGYYAQATANTLFTSNWQLLGRKSSIVAAGGIFQPAVMPISWWGLTEADNQQAVAICTVMKEFTDAGVETWLRFAHEANWYQTDGTYSGTVSDFLEGWKVVAKACKSIAPDVKMYWTPNIASAASYAAYWPGSEYVDIVGVDYYPTAYAEGIFVQNLKDFHDTYTSDTIFMAQGETALSVNSGISAQLQWAEQITSAETAAAMPNLKAIAWFNYNKEENFKIANCNGDSATKAMLASQVFSS